MATKKVRIVNIDTYKPYNAPPTISSTAVEYSFEKGVSAKGGPVAGWRRQVRLNIDSTTPLAAEGYVCNLEPGSLESNQIGSDPSVVGQSYLSRIEGYICPLVQPPRGAQINMGQADNTAITRFVSRANDAIHKFQGGPFIGELAETVRSLRRPGEALFKGIMNGYFTALKKKRQKLNQRRPRRNDDESNRRHIAERTDVLAGTWLEWSFGLAPLIADIDGAMQEIAQSYTGIRVPTKRIQGTGSETSVALDASTQTSKGAFLASARNVMTYSVDVKYYGNVIVAKPDISAWSPRYFGLTWSEFIPTLWEIIPYSFLVDYFVNIGDIISALAFPRANLNWVAKATKWENTSRLVDINVRQTVPNGFWRYEGGGYVGRSLMQTRGINRSRYVGDLVPSLELKVPGTSLKWLNLTALAATHRNLIPF